MRSHRGEWLKGYQKLTLAELSEDFDKAARGERVGLVEYIAKHPAIKRREKMAFLLGVCESDQSLTVAEYAGRYFIELAQIDAKPLECQKLREWWEVKKDTILD